MKIEAEQEESHLMGKVELTLFLDAALLVLDLGISYSKDLARYELAEAVLCAERARHMEESYTVTRTPTMSNDNVTVRWDD